MPRFAPVAGIDVMVEIQQQIGGDYHLWLAHDVLKAPFKWQALAQHIHKNNPDACIIMDNSLIELGYPLPDEELIKAVRITEAELLVLPDKLGDCEETIRLATDSWLSITDKMKMHTLSRAPVRFMAVIQGKDRSQMLRCASALAGMPHVEALSVPRVTTELLGSRFYIADEIYATYGKPIHLLGFSDNIPDDIASCHIEGVMGIDSAVPIRMGIARKKIQQLGDAGKRDNLYFGLTASAVNSQVIENINTVRRWVY